mgnify:CR=1 FL=1
MKQIEPISIWQNGTTKTATQLNVIGTGVVLSQSASFAWQLLTDEGHQVSNGNMGISGEQYDAWGADDNYVYAIVASDLKLTLVSEE